MLNGTTIAIPVNALTNQLSNAYYDLNGNMTSGAGATFAYNVADQLSSATEVSGGTEYYSYDPSGKRIYRLKAGGATEEWTLYGAAGERLGVYSLGTYTFTPLRTDVIFAGRVILDANKAAFNDAVGTSRANAAVFYPYGDEATSTGNDHVKFGTYTRNSFTGLDYADQRDYASMYGRFNTADQYQASGVPKDPGSWNRYSYATGAPVNLSDPHGNDSCEPEDPFCSDLLSSIDDGWGTGKCQFGYFLDEYNTCQFVIAPMPKLNIPAENCPLVSIIGGFTNDPRSQTPIHDSFAPSDAYALDAVIFTLNAQGIVPIVEYGFRTESEQVDRQNSYPGVAATLSYHEIGDAIDFKRNQKDIAAITAAMAGAGFTNGATFSTPDLGHFQLSTGPLTQTAAAACTEEHPNGH